MKRKYSFNALLENGTFLIILSLIGAVLVWYSAASADTGSVQPVRNVPVFVDLEDSALARLGLDPVTEPSFSVDVEIQGPRTLVGLIKASDVKVVAKLNNVNGPGTYDLALEGSDLGNKGFEVISIVPSTVVMRFDHTLEKTLPVQLELSGLEIPEDYLLNQPYVYPSEITVKGPATEMADVNACRVVADFEQSVAQTITFEQPAEILNSNGDAVTMTYLNVSQPNISITLPILKKKVVPVSFEFLNVPRNFSLDSLRYSIDPETIELAGPVTSINSMTELHLGYIDLRTLEPNTSLYYSTTLPSGYISVENIQNISVEFDPDGYGEQDLNIPSTGIRLINQPTDYAVTMRTRTINGVVVFGPKEEVGKITSKDLVAQLDMSDIDLRIGTMTVPVTVLLPNSESCWAYGKYSVVIDVKSK